MTNPPRTPRPNDAFWLSIILAGCGATAGNGGSIGNEQRDASLSGGPCEEESDDGRLKLIGRIVIRPLSSSCGWLTPTLLLRNTSSEPITVETVEIVPSPLSVLGSVPAALAPNGSLPIVLSHDGKEPEVEGTLRVHHTYGCSDFEVIGYATPDLYATRNTYAIDFGETAVGTESKVREVITLFHGAPASGETVEHGGFAASSPFFLTSKPDGYTNPEPCSEHKLGVVFRAPREPGHFEGRLDWFMTTTSADGTQFSAALRVQLFGQAVAK